LNEQTARVVLHTGQRKCRICEAAYAREKSQHHHPLYYTWKQMRQRCTNPRNHTWPRYGALGVTVCERWSSFDNFAADMGERPDGMSLDRINPFGNYEPGNCRWATPVQQARNKRASWIKNHVAHEAFLTPTDAETKG